MPLKIETFDNRRGGNSFYKAVTHPLAARAAQALLERLGRSGPVALYDPLGFAEGFAELYDLTGLTLAGVFVQDIGAVGRLVRGLEAQPVTALGQCAARILLVAAFDAGRLIDHIRHLVPAGCEVVSFDALRLPEALLGNKADYLDPLNFATNFAFFRDGENGHTRLVTANYWAGYGAERVSLFLALFDGGGEILAEWREEIGAGTIVLDSREIRRRFGLPAFAGQLFLHVVGAKGHDVVKYALDVFGPEAGPNREGGRDAGLSCTHDANSWPSALYAGLPAPRPGERVILWIQNSHPCPIPEGAMALGLMGGEMTGFPGREVPAYASLALDIAELIPEAAWPAQLELQAGKHVVRPRYEVVKASHRRIAHVNVERSDTRPDPAIPGLCAFLGKGYLLPAPILPLASWRAEVLPTPMSVAQANLPVALILYDASGAEIRRHRFGTLRRNQSVALAIDDVLEGLELPSGYGHMELVYDFGAADQSGGEADGWLHGLFRYEHRLSGHAAETSFGAHIFNTVLTYGSEPQSYSGRPPGLSTRLFLRLGVSGFDTICHLIYPASTPWHGLSTTELILHDGGGAEVARRQAEIPCSGSLFWRYSDYFDETARQKAGDRAYLVIRDQTCRLFGYHGLVDMGGDGDSTFSLDHMFGF